MEQLDVRRFWILIVAELLLLSLLVFPVTSESPEGFVSIDCGAAGGWDRTTTLDWKGDREYLQNADQLSEECVSVNATAGYPTRVDNAERLKTALVFYPAKPGGLQRSKYCYTLPVFNPTGRPKIHLLRATFPSCNLTATSLNEGTSKDINGGPISFGASRFYFSVDSTYISTIELHESDPQTIELLITPVDTNVYVCLSPVLEDRSSIPAISGLELRPLSDDMSVAFQDYLVSNAIQGAGETSYFMTIFRLNFGGDPNRPLLRYPSDKYDRLWSAPQIMSTDVKPVVNTSVMNVSNSVVDMPEEVMSTAWEGKSLRSSISFKWNFTNPRPQRPMSNFICVLFFYDILDTSNVRRVVDILYDIDEGTGIHDPQNYSAGYEISDRFGNPYRWLRIVTEGTITFTVRLNSTSQLPAMINGAQMYGKLNSVIGRTVRDDADAVRNFAVKFPDRLDASGDPCLPVPWAWIVCNMEVPPRVTQINLTSKLQGIPMDLPRAFGSLNRLTVLDFSNNSFTGTVPSSVGNISALRSLNLGRNDLSGELRTFTSDRGSLQNLEFLSLSDNRLSGNLSSLISGLDNTLSVLDVSNNSFNGSIPVDIQKLVKLQNLNVSNNQLSGELNVDLVQLKNLQTLDLGNNQISGTVPDNLWNTPSLTVANLSKNSFTKLNLTTWYTTVVETKSFEKSSFARRKVRLVKNQIDDVILPEPSLPALDTIIVSPSTEEEQRRTLRSPAAFILLADNPWCKDRMRRGPSTILLERYLCRSDEHLNFWPAPSREWGVKTRIVILVVVLCGLVAVVMACVLAYFLWRMRGRARELHQIQEATKISNRLHNFSSNSILGRGGFGTVYKANLPDGRVLAVKKLNPTEQNTCEFLKEVVNITGIKHKHLIQLKGCCVREKQQRILVYEYAENKSLAEALWGPDRPVVLSWKQRFSICLGIARGLTYLHDELQPKMVHRDIKPQNILLDKDYSAKIADFGLVRLAQTDNRTQITFHIRGTRGYCSPEYMIEGVVSEKLDVYSYGVVLLEIVSGRKCISHMLPEEEIYLPTWAMRLYEGDELLSLVDKDLAGEYDQEEVLLTLETALECCQLDSKKRPTMSQVMNILIYETSRYSN